jgi:uroporphyrin-III C-methyltransferase / precorrin-2 dehydrogenase / sirohydrochlorin ferrochelatase
MTFATGRVWLVGAGPGDPGLLTRRALALLRHADLVLYDALVPDAIVTLAKRGQRFSVGKRAGRPSVRQETINGLMIRAAKRGRRVVRLKAGDPFVLGRGGEEALALRAAGVPFEVVPGVSSAVAAPALAGIPVTHRGLSAGVIVVSGHAEESYRPLLEMLPPHAITLVVLMGLRQLESIASLLISTGWRPRTPVAVIFGAGTPDASTWTGTLDSARRAELQFGQSDARRAGLQPGRINDAPATIVIGDVVSLAAVIGESQSTAAREAAGSQDSHVSHG